MKKNLSSQAIKAMAISMAVTMASSTAISNVYADEFIASEQTETAVSEANPNVNDTITVKDGSVVYTFKVLTQDNNDDANADGTVALVSISEDGTSVNAQATNHEGIIENLTSASCNVVKVMHTTDQKAYFKITRLGEFEPTVLNYIQSKGSIAPNKTISATSLEKVFTTNLEEIGTNALKNVTIDGDFKIDANTNTKSDGVKLGSNAFKGLVVNGNLDLKGAKFKSWKNSNPEITVLSDLGLGSLDNEVQLKLNGVTVTGELILPTDITVDNSSLKNTKIGKINLTNYAKSELPKGLFGNAEIGELILDNSTTTININTFAGATLTKFDFKNIKDVKWGAFKGATINGDIDFNGDNVNKQVFGELKKEGSETILKEKTTTINGNVNLSGAKLEESDKGFVTEAKITGDLNLTGTTIPKTTDEKGAFGNVTVEGNLILTGVTNLPENAFKGSTIKNPVNVDVTKTTTIGANSLALKEGTVNLVGYTNDKLNSIPVNAFGEANGSAIKVTVPFGTSDTDMNKLKEHLNNKNVIVSEAPITIENENGTYKFEKITTVPSEPASLEEVSVTNGGNVALVGFEPKVVEEIPVPAEKLEAPQGTFENGKLTYNKQEYTLTKLGNGTDKLIKITNKDLDTHLDNVTEVSANAFDGNASLTTISLPKVEKIGANAFANTNITTVDLGKLDSTIANNIDASAFATSVEEGKDVTINVPFGTNDADIKTLQDKLTNKKAKVNEKLAVVTNAQGIYTFERLTTSQVDTKEVSNGNIALVKFEPKSTIALNDDVAPAPENSFDKGLLTYNNGKYTLTKVGDGTSSLSTITNEALKGHTDNVTEISAKAFEGNKNLNDVSFPKVEKIGSKAFANTNVSKVDLGSQANTTTIEKDAFDGVSNSIEIKTNASSKDAILGSIDNSNIIVNGTKKPTESSSSGGSSSAGGAVVNPTPNDTSKEDKKEESTSSEDKVTNVNESLTLDVIKLPSIDGEAKTFGDVSNDYWAKAHIDKLSTAGIINGSNGMFNPNGKTKRADVTVMLVNLLGLTPEANNNFSDVNPNTYYAPYVGTASAYGIVNGSNGMFNPENVISRQDTMVMIAQILKSLDLNVNTDATILNQFTDASKIAPYANENVAILVNSGIISGNNGKLNPTAPVTRAEMATIMSKLYDILAQTK